jgi:glycosyltransferase involved in cell wall biosynthesis
VHEPIAREKLDDVTHVGRLDPEDVAREMGQAAYVLVPSLWQEPFGAVALEAVAAGAIPVAANRGGLAEACGDLALLFDPGDEQSFVDALEAARERRHLLMRSPAAWEDYRDRINTHVARFQPAASVSTIIKAMFN